MTHVSRPPDAFSYGWPSGFVAAAKSTAYVPSMDPVWRGLFSFPRATVTIVTTAAITTMAAIGITTAVRRHQRGGGGAVSDTWPGTCFSRAGDSWRLSALRVC